MPKDTDALKKLNESGYPLQIAVEHQVKTSVTRNGWSVRHTEHAWTNGDESGFIDLVLQDKQSSMLVVECKRTKATWLFMGPAGYAKPRRHAKAWVTAWESGATKVFEWRDIAIDPNCSETLFCTVQGQASNDKRPMLERIGGELISATEALAKEEKDFHRQRMLPMYRFYFDVLVTTAEIKVAHFEPGEISLENGMLADADFQTLPYLKFRKQMAMRERLFTREDFENGVDPADAKENTLFVVNAASLLDFLNAFELPDGPM